MSNLRSMECPGCGMSYLTAASGALHDFATCKARNDAYGASREIIKALSTRIEEFEKTLRDLAASFEKHRLEAQRQMDVFGKDEWMKPFKSGEASAWNDAVNEVKEALTKKGGA